MPNRHHVKGNMGIIAATSYEESSANMLYFLNVMNVIETRG
jgi:hypothetical protein